MASQVSTNPKILFFVTTDPDGGFNAKAPKFGIYTQGDTWDQLIANIKEAILCHFEEGEAPSSFVYQIVKREEMAI